MRYVLLVLFAAAVIAGIGCASLSESVTPARVDSRAVQYAAEAGVIDPNDFGGYHNLLKALRLEQAVEGAYAVKQLAAKQLAEKNELDYGLLRGVVTANAEIGRRQEAALFGEKGLVSLGLGLLGAGGFAGVLGLMRKRPGDWTQTEVDAALVEAGIQADDRTRQLTEVVKGVQTFLDAHKGDPTAAELKAALSRQSLDTRQAVALAKASA